MDDVLCLRNYEFVGDKFFWLCLHQLELKKARDIVLTILDVTNRDEFSLMDFEEGEMRDLALIIIEVKVLKGMLAEKS